MGNNIFNNLLCSEQQNGNNTSNLKSRNASTKRTRTEGLTSLPPSPNQSKLRKIYDSPSNNFNNLLVDGSSDVEFNELVLRLKFVNREKESNAIVQTLAANRIADSLSDAKLLCLFQTFGIGKTALVKRFRKVYEENNQWDEETSFIRDMELLILDFRFSQHHYTDLDEKVKDLLLECYHKQFLQDSSVSEELKTARVAFYNKLKLLPTCSKMFSYLDSSESPEGYLVFLDEVDELCAEKDDTTQLQALFSSVSPLIIGKRSAVIISGHSPIQFQSLNNNYTHGSFSDYKMIFLSQMDESKLELMLEKTEVKINNGQIISLMQALSLLGMNNEKEFISLLKEYTGTVPRIMVNALDYILKHKKKLDTKEKIETLLINTACQKSRDVTLSITSLEQAQLLSKLFTLFCFNMPIPYSAVTNYNGRDRFLVELLPLFLIHFQVSDELIYLNIPKVIQRSFISSLSPYSSYIGVRNHIINSYYTHGILCDRQKFLELSVIDILVDRITLLNFTHTDEEVTFGEICKGIFENTYFSSLVILPKKVSKALIPGMICNSKATSCDWSTESIFSRYLSPCSSSFSFILEQLNMSHCFAIPAPLNTGYDVLFTLNTTNSVVLFQMKLHSENNSFSLPQLQTEINQVISLLPTNPVSKKPNSETSDELRITLVMVVFGYCESIEKVINKNSSKGSLLISGTCYLDSDDSLRFHSNHIGEQSWLKISRGGLEVVLLSNTGLANLLGGDVVSFFNNERNEKEVMYRNFIGKYML